MKNNNFNLKSYLMLVIMLIMVVGCNENRNNVVVPSLKINNSIQNNSNPYEWVGVSHNDIVIYIQNNYIKPSYSGNWIDTSFSNILFTYGDTACNILYGNIIPDLDNYDLRTWYNQLNTPKQLLQTFKTEILNNSGITNKDKNYCLKVMDLSYDILINTRDLDSSISRIKSLERELLSTQWDLSKEYFALYSISLFKHSYLLWANMYNNNDNTKNTSQLQGKSKVDRMRVAANAAVDYCVGAGTFLAATGASGGAGAVAGAWAGVKAGAIASQTADWLGSVLKWW